MSTPEPNPSPAGVEHTGVIDLLAHDPGAGTVTLVMLERRPFDGSPKRLFELQEKFNAYLSFILDGEMAEAYPHLMGLPVRVRLDCLTEPDPQSAGMLGAIREQIAFQGIELELCVHRPEEQVGGCGSCGCG